MVPAPNGGLYAINPATGEAVLRGLNPPSPGNNVTFGLAFAPEEEGEGINDATTHMVRVPDPGIPRSAKAAPVLVNVTDQFGPHSLGVVKPDGILVPTNFSFSSTPSIPTQATHNRDRFLCYKVVPLPVNKVVDVVDGLENRTYTLSKITRVCTPVDVSGAPAILSGPDKGNPFPVAPSTIRNRERLVCYAARADTRHIKRNGFIANQVMSQRIDTLREAELCVPTIEPAGPPPTPTPIVTPTPTAPPPGPCLTPSPSPIYGSTSKAFLAPASTLLD